MRKIYDFHTHISKNALSSKCKCNDNEIVEYINQGIVPVINVQNLEEYKYYKTAEYIYDREVLHKTSEVLDCKDLSQKVDRDLDKRIVEKANSTAYFSVGVHPFYADNFRASFANFSAFESLIKGADFVGEIGMDNYWAKSNLDVQEEIFVKCLKLAEKYNKKVILHTKGMEEKILEIIKQYKLTYIVHWYACDDFIDEYIDTNSYFTIGPAIYKEESVRSLVEKCPLDRLLIETDGIDALEWLNKEKVNVGQVRDILESVIEKIGQIKGIDSQVVYEQIKINSEKILADIS